MTDRSKTAVELLNHPNCQALASQLAEIARTHELQEAKEHLGLLLEAYISSEMIESQHAQTRSYVYSVHQELSTLLEQIFEARAFLLQYLQAQAHSLE